VGSYRPRFVDPGNLGAGVCDVDAARKDWGLLAAPERCWLMGLLIGSVVAVGWEDDKATVDRERLQLNAESQSFLMWKCSTDLGPAFLGLAVSFVFLDGEDVQVGGGGSCNGGGWWYEVSLRGVAVVHLCFRAMAIDGRSR
jgi:hypothetical protein